MDPRKPNKKPRRIARAVGYHGGAFFSPDCSKLGWRASRPTGDALKDYQRCSRKTSSDRATWRSSCPDFESPPVFSPDGRKLVLASSRNAKGHHDFNLFLADWVGH